MEISVCKMAPILSVVILACLGSCQSKPPKAQHDAEILLNLEKEGIKREFQNDTAFLSSIMDSTFIEVANDKLKNKHEVLATIYQNNISNLEKKVSLDSFRLEEPIIHVYGNAAVVTFIMHTFRKKEDSLLQRRTRFYDVWVKRDMQWKAVTWQATPIK
ncbi:MAG: nuclear transport factor 2 family protein [Chitinophagaceae bacterium]|nr:MAG: nuclear transport factor 2 family protein [Chitinophagaceae bacterium]